jgi:hypothetical protein
LITGLGLEHFRKDTEKQASGQATHQDARERFDATDQTPLFRQRQVTVAGGWYKSPR